MKYALVLLGNLSTALRIEKEEAFRFSVAAGSATAFSIGLCTREKMEGLLPQVKIEMTKQRGE
ncbi:hypothetical protein [Neobacillus niacini]|uniref:hypothetical protein n=1 Tax=Neobacillus niacini TaxID=86668 RepID=UPI0005EFDE15